MAQNVSQAEANKAIVRRYIEEGWNKGNLGVVDELFTPDYVNHDAFPGQNPGPAGLKQLIAMFRAAADDIHMQIDDQIAEGDKVVTRWTAGGTLQGPLMGVEPRGQQIEVAAIVIARIADGRIVEWWGQRDDLGMMQQLGVIPVSAQAAV
jgi:steroid delta-isomerase-like uncharacterized protein